MNENKLASVYVGARGVIEVIYTPAGQSKLGHKLIRLGTCWEFGMPLTYCTSKLLPQTAGLQNCTRSAGTRRKLLRTVDALREVRDMMN